MTFNIDIVGVTFWTLILVLTDVVTAIPLSIVFKEGEEYVKEVSSTWVVRYHFWSKLFIWSEKAHGRVILLTTLVLPLIEETIFFAIPYLVHPSYLTISAAVWCVYHVVTWRYAAIEAGRSVLKVTACACLNFGTITFLKILVWLFGYGLASILHHILINTMLSWRDLATYLKTEKEKRELIKKARRYRRNIYTTRRYVY